MTGDAAADNLDAVVDVVPPVEVYGAVGVDQRRVVPSRVDCLADRVEAVQLVEHGEATHVLLLKTLDRYMLCRIWQSLSYLPVYLEGAPLLVLGLEPVDLVVRPALVLGVRRVLRRVGFLEAVLDLILRYGC